MTSPVSRKITKKSSGPSPPSLVQELMSMTFPDVDATRSIGNRVNVPPRALTAEYQKAGSDPVTKYDRDLKIWMYFSASGFGVPPEIARSVTVVPGPGA